MYGTAVTRAASLGISGPDSVTLGTAGVHHDGRSDILWQNSFPAAVLPQDVGAAPSPLKSPVPSACQLGPGLPRTAVAVAVVPFISQMPTAPLSSCHRRSE